MTRRTRLYLALAAAVVIAALGTAVVASFFTVQSDSPRDIAELAYVAADARVVAFADVRQITNSALRQKFRDLRPDGDGNDSLEARTGINPETDVSHVLVALLPGEGSEGQPLTLARGTFDRARIEKLIMDRGGRVEEYRGTRILIPASEPAQAVAFAETDLALLGPVAAVRGALDTKAAGRNVTGNTELMAWVGDVMTASAWAVGRFDAIAGDGRVPRDVTAQLPPIGLFSASGRIDGAIRAVFKVETPDATEAENLRQVVQGFVALGRLQAGSNSPLATVLNTVELAGDGPTVAISFTVPPEALDLLTPRLRARQQASAATLASAP